MLTLVLLSLLGMGAGAYGSLIGAGGGFLLIPALLLLYPRLPAATVTAISLTMVFFTALSGTAAYARQRRIEYRSGVLFAAATVPGAILGALVARSVTRALFDPLFGALLLLVAAYLSLRPRNPAHPSGAMARGRQRLLTDAQGQQYRLAVNEPLGVTISLGVGFLASLLGIGGAIIQVPALIVLMAFPPHIATATALFSLLFTSLTAVLTRVAVGSYGEEVAWAIAISTGALLGAQGGAWLSRRVRGGTLVRLLGLGLGAVGVRLLLSALGGP